MKEGDGKRTTGCRSPLTPVVRSDLSSDERQRQAFPVTFPRRQPSSHKRTGHEEEAGAVMQLIVARFEKRTDGGVRGSNKCCRRLLSPSLSLSRLLSLYSASFLHLLHDNRRISSSLVSSFSHDSFSPSLTQLGNSISGVKSPRQLRSFSSTACARNTRRGKRTKERQWTRRWNGTRQQARADSPLELVVTRTAWEKGPDPASLNAETISS